MSESVAPSTPSQGTSEGQGTEAVNQTPVNETPAQAERRKLKAKVNGQEVDVYEDDIVRDYQKYSSADEKLREAAQKRKEIEAFYERLENDPEGILNDKRLPIDRQKLAMKWLTEQVEEELASADPKDAKLSELERKLAEYQNRDREVEETKAEQEKRQLVESRRELIANTLTKAIELSPLSKDPDTAAATIREMAMHMRICKDAGYDVSPEELARHVEGKSLKSMRSLALNLKGEDLISFLGEDVVMELRRTDLARIKKSREVPKPETVSEWTPSSSSPRKFYDPSELRTKY